MTHLRDILDVNELEAALERGLVRIRRDAASGLATLNYTPEAQYKGIWTDVTRQCRGLVIEGEIDEAVVVARPFAKFGNLGEYGTGSAMGEIPWGADLTVTEKLDGSLISGAMVEDAVRLCSRKSLDGWQGEAANALWRAHYAGLSWPEGVTPVFEYVSPANRVVVRYEREDLVLLGAIDIASGADVEWAEWPGPRARVVEIRDGKDLGAALASDEENAEGFVLRFTEDPGRPSVRVKAKFAQYVEAHRVATMTSELTIWESLRSGRGVERVLELAPDELYGFVERTAAELTARHRELLARARDVAESVAGMGRKEAAARVLAVKDVNHSLVFAVLDGRENVEEIAWKDLRPRGDEGRGALVSGAAFRTASE